MEESASQYLFDKEKIHRIFEKLKRIKILFKKCEQEKSNVKEE